jgi:hypothetical protein
MTGATQATSSYQDDVSFRGSAPNFNASPVKSESPSKQSDLCQSVTQNERLQAAQNTRKGILTGQTNLSPAV